MVVVPVVRHHILCGEDDAAHVRRPLRCCGGLRVDPALESPNALLQDLVVAAEEAICCVRAVYFTPRGKLRTAYYVRTTEVMGNFLPCCRTPTRGEHCFKNARSRVK